MAPAAAAEPQSKCPRGVDPDEPVRLISAPGGAGQRFHLSVAAQSREPVADRLRHHRLQPETLDRLFRASVLHDIPKDQFAFPARVARVNDVGNVFVPDELAKNTDAAAHFLRGLKLEFRRHDGKLLHVPFVLFFHWSMSGGRKEIADRPRARVFLLRVMILTFFMYAGWFCAM